ncbi:MAG: ATP-binding protein, partial [Alphaproteobacteria bacterium]
MSMAAAVREQDALTWLAGGGEMGARIRSFDWARTPLGQPAQWPESLRTAVRIMLTSPQPMFVWWGDARLNIYNDAYRAVLGRKHPEALGRPAAEIWREIWDEVGSRADIVMHQNKGTFDEGLLLIMDRYGYREETYYTFSYSPVPDGAAGVGGLFCACNEETHRIVGERQMALLRELAARTADARTIAEACEAAAAALATNAHDLPFAVLYRVDAERRRAVRAGLAGILDGHEAAPPAIELDERAIWPLKAALDGNVLVPIADLGASRGRLPTGAWGEPPGTAVVLPIVASGASGQAAALVVGCNPYR